MKFQRTQILWVIGIITGALVGAAILHSRPALAGPQIEVYLSPG